MSWTTAGVCRSMPRTRPPWAPPRAGGRAGGREMGKPEPRGSGRRGGEGPHERVDADPSPPAGRHAVLERADVVLVEPVRLGVAAREELPLLAEAGELVDRVVQ